MSAVDWVPRWSARWWSQMCKALLRDHDCCFSFADGFHVCCSLQVRNLRIVSPDLRVMHGLQLISRYSAMQSAMM